MALFSGRADGLYHSDYGMLKQQDLKIFVAKNNKEWEEKVGKPQDYKSLSPIMNTLSFKLVNSQTNGFQSENSKLFEGSEDLCCFENSPNGGLIYYLHLDHLTLRQTDPG